MVSTERSGDLVCRGMSQADAIVLYRSCTVGRALDATLADMSAPDADEALKLSEDMCIECLAFFDSAINKRLAEVKSNRVTALTVGRTASP